jgi:hypothetical protein
MLLVTDFINLKIKLIQYFRGDHKGMVCLLIEVSARIFMNIYVYTMFLNIKKLKTSVQLNCAKPAPRKAKVHPANLSRGTHYNLWLVELKSIFLSRLFFIAFVVSRTEVSFTFHVSKRARYYYLLHTCLV